MRVVSVLLLAIMLQANAHAAQMIDAEHAMRSGNYAEAYCVLRPMAEQGDAEAQYNIGWMYHNGYGLAVNDSLALEWWRRASEQGHVDASFSIATLYNHGAGEVERDRDKALDYFLVSAQAGHDDAMLIVRSMLIRDDVAIRERKTAIIDKYGYLFGDLKQVKVPKANIRAKDSVDAKLVGQLVQADTVIEFDRRNNWSQVAIPGKGMVAWVYSPLLEEVEEKVEQAPAQQQVVNPPPASRQPMRPPAMRPWR